MFNIIRKLDYTWGRGADIDIELNLQDFPKGPQNGSEPNLNVPEAERGLVWVLPAETT